MSTYKKSKGKEDPIEELTRFCLMGKVDEVEKMIKNGTPVNCYDLLGRTPLHYACVYPKPFVISLLISNGADVNVISLEKVRMAPLHYAVQLGHTENIKELIAHGADLNILASVDKDFK